MPGFWGKIYLKNTKDFFEKYKKKNLPTTRNKDNQISLGDTMPEGFIPHKADAASYSIEDGSAFT